jgi:hypothetical protein
MDEGTGIGVSSFQQFYAFSKGRKRFFYGAEDPWAVRICAKKEQTFVKANQSFRVREFATGELNEQSLDSFLRARPELFPGFIELV